MRHHSSVLLGEPILLAVTVRAQRALHTDRIKPAFALPYPVTTDVVNKLSLAFGLTLLRVARGENQLSTTVSPECQKIIRRRILLRRMRQV